MNHKLLLFLLLALAKPVFSQHNSIAITLKSNSLITTQWIKLYDFPLFQKPYIRIDHTHGPKIKIQNIQHYRGFDQLGNYRQLDVIDFYENGKFYFTERNFRTDSTEKVKLYTQQLTYGLWQDSRIRKKYSYALTDGVIKKLSYRNVKYDLSGNQSALHKLNRVNQIQALQFVAIGIGVALLTDVLLTNWNPSDADFMNKASNTRLMAGGLLLTLPFTLEKPKQKRLMEALRN